MKQELKKKVQRIMPERLSKHVLEIYKRGRARLISARYGNPAGVVRVIAVVGDYGKTTTIRLISELLEEAGRKVVTDTATEGSEGDDVAASLQQALKKAKQADVEFFILEVTPELLATGVLSGVSLDTVVVTSQNATADELLQRDVNYVVVPEGYQAGLLAIAEHQIISFGEQENAEMKIDAITLYRKGTEIRFTIDHHTALTVATHLVGKANAYNLAAAVATAYVLGVALATVEEGAARLEAMPGNFQYVPSDKQATFIVDAAPKDRSVVLVAESAKELTRRRLITALVADGLTDETIAQVKKLSDRLILVSSTELALPGIEVVESIEEASLLASRAAKKDDTVLLLGGQFVDQASVLGTSDEDTR